MKDARYWGVFMAIIVIASLTACTAAKSKSGNPLAGYTLPPKNVLLAEAKKYTPDPTDAPDPTDTPSPTPTTYAEYIKALKRQFMANVNESITGSMIAGNRFKYVGKAVDLHCTVADIPDQSFFNASCGQDSNGLPVTIVIEYATKDLAQAQSVRVLGVVDKPMEGVNGFGGSSTFPTVKAFFMQ